MSRFFPAALAAAFFVSASASQAQPQCGPREILLRQLAEKYGEEPVALGVVHNGSLLEMVMTPDGSTWSMVLTSPSGVSCLVAAGEGWRWRGPKQEGPEA